MVLRTKEILQDLTLPFYERVQYPDPRFFEILQVVYSWINKVVMNLHFLELIGMKDDCLSASP